MDELPQSPKLPSRQEIWERFLKTWVAVGEKNAHFSEEEVIADLELATLELKVKRATEMVRRAKANADVNAVGFSIEEAWAQYDTAVKKLRKALRDNRTSTSQV